MQEYLVSMRSPAYGLLRRAGKLRCGIAALLCTLGLGFSVAAAEDPGALRLVALGDSLTQGYGLEQGDGLVPQLEGWLREAGHDVNVINAGVSGDTTAGGLSRLDWTLAEEPDAMLVILGGNDLLRGIDPAASRANLDAILARLSAEGIPAMLVGLPAPGNYGPEFRDAFEAMYVDLAAEYDAPLYPNLLQPMSEKHELGLTYAELMQEDRLHPSALGVQAIVEGLGPQVSDWLHQIAAEESEESES